MPFLPELSGRQRAVIVYKMKSSPILKYKAQRFFWFLLVRIKLLFSPMPKKKKLHGLWDSYSTPFPMRRAPTMTSKHWNRMYRTIDETLNFNKSN